jgi:integrase/recombinase XerD
MLGHEDLGTTEVYMHLDTTHIKEELLNCHPMNKKNRNKTFNIP